MQKEQQNHQINKILPAAILGKETPLVNDTGHKETLHKGRTMREGGRGERKDDEEDRCNG